MVPAGGMAPPSGPFPPLNPSPSALAQVPSSSAPWISHTPTLPEPTRGTRFSVPTRPLPDPGKMAAANTRQVFPLVGPPSGVRQPWGSSSLNPAGRRSPQDIQGWKPPHKAPEPLPSPAPFFSPPGTSASCTALQGTVPDAKKAAPAGRSWVAVCCSACWALSGGLSRCALALREVSG